MLLFCKVIATSFIKWGMIMRLTKIDLRSHFNRYRNPYAVERPDRNEATFYVPAWRAKKKEPVEPNVASSASTKEVATSKDVFFPRQFEPQVFCFFVFFFLFSKTCIWFAQRVFECVERFNELNWIYDFLLDYYLLVEQVTSVVNLGTFFLLYCWIE
jgi:hypothetical protein